MPNRAFFRPLLKKAKNMRIYDVHAKPLLKRPNVWNLTVKMPTWQPWTKLRLV